MLVEYNSPTMTIELSGQDMTSARHTVLTGCLALTLTFDSPSLIPRLLSL